LYYLSEEGAKEKHQGSPCRRQIGLNCILSCHGENLREASQRGRDEEKKIGKQNNGTVSRKLKRQAGSNEKSGAQ